MPGILTMNSRGADAATGPRDAESKKRTHDGKLLNGERNGSRTDALTGATSINGSTNFPGVNSASALGMQTSVTNQIAELPPELTHLTAEHYFSLGTMLQRIGQDCYNDLNEALQKMADLSNSYPAKGVGPYGMANGGQETSEQSRQKKLTLMKFAQENRAKFIKLLVLAEWGRRDSVDVAKLIDVFGWSRAQCSSMDAVDEQIFQIKNLTAHTRHSNPDIRTALRILATQKADWIPAMDYIPSEQISPDKAVKLLRYMNSCLSIRLTVHEDLPRHLQKWRVESGRAIFIVDDEFELDLISFVEDTSDQWHFIDLRLLFSPAPAISVESHFFHQLKLQLDGALQDQGLGECFNYLHNFILTHKISILRSQAYELIRAGWAGSLRVDQVHRGLTIQYWTEKPGRKNWIEFGISSNRPTSNRPSWRGTPIPSLTVRWFRQGIEVKDANLNFDWKNLSVERMLKRVMALHIGHSLRSIHQTISPRMTTIATLSETEPSDCKLQVSMGSADKSTLTVEPVTGRYILHPATLISSHTEHAINRPQEASHISNTLTQFLARSLIELIQRCAQQLGWQQIARQALRIDVIKAAVDREVLQYTLFSPRGWSTSWALAAVVDASGESWWICDIGLKGNTIECAKQITMDKPAGHPSLINRTTLASIKRVAVHTISYHVTTQALIKENKTFDFGYDFAQPRHEMASQAVVRGWVLYLKTADLLASKPDESPWLEPGMRVISQGLRVDSDCVWHIASGTLVPNVATDMKKLMSASPQKNFSFSEEGQFSILLCTPFGQDIIGELKARLRDVDRLRSFATTLQKRKMPLKSSSLQQVQFQYGKHLTAAVHFDEGDSIKVNFGSSNPHKRIDNFLTEILNERSPADSELSIGDNTGVDRFCTTLMLTRPIVTSLDEIATQQNGHTKNPAIHAHAIGTYRLTYTNPTCSFDIRLRPKDDQVFWHVEDNEGKQVEFRPKDERTPYYERSERLKSALQGLFKDRGERWYGVRTGIIAEIDGIPSALKRLHETVLSCHNEGGIKQETSSGAPGRASPSQPNGRGSLPKPNNSSVPNGKLPLGGKGGPINGKVAMGVKHEVITID